MRDGRTAELLFRRNEGVTAAEAEKGGHNAAVDGKMEYRVGLGMRWVLTSEVRRARRSCVDGDFIVDAQVWIVMRESWVRGSGWWKGLGSGQGKACWCQVLAKMSSGPF